MEWMSGMVCNKVKNSNMTPVEWIEKTIDKKYMGDYLKLVIEQAKQMEIKQAEKLKDFDTWKEWKNKTK